jgi:hypothetical protein
VAKASQNSLPLWQVPSKQEWCIKQQVLLIFQISEVALERIFMVTLQEVYEENTLLQHLSFALWLASGAIMLYSFVSVFQAMQFCSMVKPKAMKCYMCFQDPVGGVQRG